MKIGICDDNEKDREKVYQYCENFFLENKLEHDYVYFSKGEEVLEYCEKEEDRIDLLFLDVEMEGISGIEVKDRIFNENKVWRIVFVTSHLESVLDSFGIKTLGFIVKPAKLEQVEKWLRVALADIKENVEIEINSLSEKQSLILKLEDILYFEGDRNYTKLYISNHLKGDEKYKLLTKKIGELEKELKKYSIIRVHKSYMVNLHKVMSVEQNITLMGTEEKIPIGRAYKEEVRNRFIEFAKEKVRLRI